MFLPERSVVVEILPRDLGHKGFRNLAGLLGLEYFSAHAGVERKGGGGGGDWHTQDVEIEESRFLEMMGMAIGVLENRSGRNWDVV